MPKRDREGRKKNKATKPDVARKPEPRRKPGAATRKAAELQDEIVKVALTLVPKPPVFAPVTGRHTPNMLYYGDNLEVLRQHIGDETVDLVYLDPPFNSAQSYNVLFATHDGFRAAAQIKAFEDTWMWDESAARTYQEVVEAGGKVSEVMQSFRLFLGYNDVLAYLSMMAPRLVELRRVLKPTGSIYLHCDATASHYLKLLMDAVFGVTNYRNEIIWQRTSSHNDPKRYGRVHDTILFYTKSDEYVWNQQYDAKDEDFFDSHDFEHDESGRPFRKRDLTAPYRGGGSGQFEWKGKKPPAGRMWAYTKENMEVLEAEGRIVYTRTGMPRMKIYVDDLRGLPYQDVWVRPELWLNAAAKERLGYPTQKPEALLDRLIRSSSKAGALVLDPFCGCGTAVAAAQKLNRNWIGIDITHLAINLIRTRLRDAYGDAAQFEVIGEPVTQEDAKELAGTDPYQFQWWALGLVGARPAEQKKGPDKGIDGRLYFHDGSPGGKTRQIVFSVKAGHLNLSHVRDLRGVLEREKAAIGVLISLETPTRQMRSEAASAGFFETPWGKHQRIQLLTVGELLDGKRVDYPRTTGVNRTFKQAPKARIVREYQLGVFDTVARHIAPQEYPEELTVRVIQMFREAGLSSREAAERLTAAVTTAHPGYDVPQYTEQEVFVDWLNRFAPILPAGELLHFATVIRNELVHGTSVSAWPLRESGEDNDEGE